MKDIPYDLQRGKGSLEHYKYWTGGVALRTKKDIIQAIKLQFKVLRKDKILNKIEKFDYTKNKFEVEE